MGDSLATTNVLLGIMAAVGVLEALAVVGLVLGGFLLYRRLQQVIRGIEERQVAPAANRVNAIRDDIKAVTTLLKEETGRVRWVVSRVADSVQRWRHGAGAPPPRP
jgi:pyrimidine operon attenuation protein/uracil phosphoribosyltransferase